MERIVKFFQFLKEQYGIHITIKDFSRVILKNKHFSALRRFEPHENSYCMYVKSSNAARARCVESSNIDLYNKISCAKDPKRPFWGICHCGVREYVIPIVSNHIALGALLVGQYPCDAARRDSSFDRVAEKYDFDRRQLEELYYRNFSGSESPPEAILAILQVCADYIASYLSESFDFSQPHEQKSGNQMLINSAISYINAALGNGKIPISDIASYCNCSESTLSHTFRESMGMSVGNYILLRRIAKSQRLLRESNLSVGWIAEKCGFGSLEYFSNVFKTKTGYSPMEYRRQLQEKSNENM